MKKVVLGENAEGFTNSKNIDIKFNGMKNTEYTVEDLNAKLEKEIHINPKVARKHIKQFEKMI